MHWVTHKIFQTFLDSPGTDSMVALENVGVVASDSPDDGGDVGFR